MKFEYTGEVVLECQEGGFASPTVSLHDLKSDKRTGDITALFKMNWSGEELGTPLADILKGVFSEDEPDSYGDIYLGQLKITVERITSSD